ncbi:zinc-dependent metalloprotease [Streptomyces roseirectus]|uniref:Zinc-dependent metalloprotease n=1 Tax=Streptomyces roseirectus TaxID=2768066 RepID=A0A7H0IQ91_9ACTN|nr:zinc-dependent metalloprotease [Streptomyces roseirectus]QNP74957.1 zinc-dependent metalloprotease [Streptomyces roseirectus]
MNTPTTRFTVLDETHRHPELSAHLTAILHTVAPIVRETTGLPLPAEVRFRLLTPRAWRAAVRQNNERIVARDIADLELTPTEITTLRYALKIAGFIPVLTWPLIGAQIMEAADGRTEAVLAPRSLQHSGYLTNEQCLTQMAAHELVHHAQFAARGPIVWETLLHERRGLSRHGGMTVLEGHATWADRQVTTRLYGAPVNHTEQAKRSWRYRLHANIPGMSKLGPRRAFYEQGAQLIAQAVDTYGIDVLNRVWTDTSLLPTTEEITAPDTWARRLAAADPDLAIDPAEQS